MTTNTVVVTVDGKGNMSFDPEPNFVNDQAGTLVVIYDLAPDPTSQAHEFTTVGMKPSASPAPGDTTFAAATENKNKTLVVTNTNSLAKGAASVIWNYSVCIASGASHFERLDPTILDEGPK